MPFQQQLRTIAERTHWTNDDGWSPLGAYGEYRELEMTNEILLGFEGWIENGKPVLDPDRPVSIPFNPRSENPPTFLVNGPRGRGKTTVATNLLDQLVRRFGCYGFYVDPKADLWYHVYPQTKPEYVKFLESIGVPPSGLPMKIITPKFLESPKYTHTDVWYALSMEDFNSIQESSVRNVMMQTILGLSGGNEDPSIRKLKFIMSQGPKSFEQIQEILNEINESKSSLKKVEILDINLKQCLGDEVLSDGNRMDIVSTMQRGTVVVLQVSLAQEHTSSAYVAFALAQIKDGFEGGKFKGRKVAVVIDEADILAPSGASNPPSKPYAEQAYTKWRSDGCIPVVLTQDPPRISDTILKQVGYTITSRVSYGGSDYDFISRHYPETWSSGELNDLTKMFTGEDDVYPKEHAILCPDQTVKRFFALPSPSLASNPEKY